MIFGEQSFVLPDGWRFADWPERVVLSHGFDSAGYDARTQRYVTLTHEHAMSLLYRFSHDVRNAATIAEWDGVVDRYARILTGGVRDDDWI